MKVTCYLYTFFYHFLFFNLSAFALKCYACVDTEEDCKKSKLEENKVNFLYPCTADEGDRCFRLWYKRENYDAMVAIGCAKQSFCDAEKSLCDIRRDGADFQCELSCCSEDGCNASSYFTANVILLAVSSVLGLALLK